jgi:hypothetical protein
LVPGEYTHVAKNQIDINSKYKTHKSATGFLQVNEILGSISGISSVVVLHILSDTCGRKRRKIRIEEARKAKGVLVVKLEHTSLNCKRLVKLVAGIFDHLEVFYFNYLFTSSRVL